jgi:hypothetical protein
LTGNVSLRREDFARVGGFEAGFTDYGVEDYEMGYRLLGSGVRFVADRRARARHFNDATVRSMISASRQSGHGDILMAQNHPELIAGLPLAGSGGKGLRVAAGLAMYMPWLGFVSCVLKRGLLRIWERFGLRGRWQRDYAFVTWYGYWRGLHDAVGSMKNLRALRAAAPPMLEQHVDVAEDLAAQVQTLTVDVPSIINVAYRGSFVGSVELRAHIEEPLLTWMLREVPAILTTELLTEIARTVSSASLSVARVSPVMRAG